MPHKLEGDTRGGARAGAGRKRTGRRTGRILNLFPAEWQGVDALAEARGISWQEYLRELLGASAS